jgi:hypothetical protein
VHTARTVKLLKQTHISLPPGVISLLLLFQTHLSTTTTTITSSSSSIMMDMAFLYGLVPAVVESLLIAAAIKTKNRSLARTTLFLALCPLAYVGCVKSREMIDDNNMGLWKGFVGTLAFGLLFQAFGLLVVDGLDEAGLDVNRAPNAVGRPYFVRGVIVAWSARCIGSAAQIKNIFAFPKYYYNNKNNNKNNTASAKRRGSPPTPTRRAFVIRQTAMALWSYLVLDLMDVLAAQESREAMLRKHGNGIEWVAPWGRLSGEQLAARISVGIVPWFMNARVLIDLPYRLLSILAVGSGFSVVEEWPPMFGSVWEAYTIRGYWRYVGGVFFSSLVPFFLVLSPSLPFSANTITPTYLTQKSLASESSLLAHLLEHIHHQKHPGPPETFAAGTVHPHIPRLHLLGALPRRSWLRRGRAPLRGHHDVFPILCLWHHDGGWRPGHWPLLLRRRENPRGGDALSSSSVEKGRRFRLDRVLLRRRLGLVRVSRASGRYGRISVGGSVFRGREAWSAHGAQGIGSPDRC